MRCTLLMGVLLAFAGGDACPAGRPCLASTTTPATQPAERNAVGDKLRIVISDLGGPGCDVTKTSVVDEKGRIPLPYVPLVCVKGLTTNEAEMAIVKAYRDAELIYMANVSVSRVKDNPEQ